MAIIRQTKIFGIPMGRGREVTPGYTEQFEGMEPIAVGVSALAKIDVKVANIRSFIVTRNLPMPRKSETFPVISAHGFGGNTNQVSFSKNRAVTITFRYQ